MNRQIPAGRGAPPAPGREMGDPEQASTVSHLLVADDCGPRHLGILRRGRAGRRQGRHAGEDPQANRPGATPPGGSARRSVGGGNARARAPPPPAPRPTGGAARAGSVGAAPPGQPEMSREEKIAAARAKAEAMKAQRAAGGPPPPPETPAQS